MLISTDTWHKEHLEALRKVIVPEAEKRLSKNGRYICEDLAAWLIAKHRDRVIGALICCISDAMDRDEDEERMQDILADLKERSELDEEECGGLDEHTLAIRHLSEMVGVPQWYLFMQAKGT